MAIPDDLLAAVRQLLAVPHEGIAYEQLEESYGLLARVTKGLLDEIDRLREENRALERLVDADELATVLRVRKLPHSDPPEGWEARLLARYLKR